MGGAPTAFSSFAQPGAGRRALLLVTRIGLGAVFIYAAYTKLRHPWMLFAFSVNSYQILPEWAVTLVARTLPWLELLLGLLLVSGYQLRCVAVASSALLLGFFAVMLRAHFKGLGIDCGCFGFGEKLGVRTLVRDGALVAVSLAVSVAAFAGARSNRLRPPTTSEDPKAD